MANSSLKREQTADDLVGAIVFLTSDDAAFVSGQTIYVDDCRHYL